MELKGDISNLQEIQHVYIKKVIEDEGFSDSDVNVEAVGKKGDNYAAFVKRIIAKNQNGKTFNLFAKIAPSMEMFRKMMNSAVMFSNETAMYTEVLPTFFELQKSAGLSVNECFNFSKCYGVIKEEPNELILLEDLNESGFIIRDRMVSLTDKEVKLVLTKLATLHSLSFVLRIKNPEKYNELTKKLEDVWGNPDKMEEIKVGFKSFEQLILAFFDNEEYKKRSTGAVSEMPSLAESLSKADANSPYSVILQGDIWTNNIMFKMQDDDPVECIIVDYQISRPGSPVIDLLYFIFNCTDKETRSNYYFDWLEHYYKSLDESLFNFNLKASVIYPRDKLDADLKRHGKLGYGLGLLLASVLVRESEEAMTFHDKSEEDFTDILSPEKMEAFTNLKEESSVRMRKRLNDLYESFVEYGYI